MTRVICITGGIGSGKTTVCKVFESLNIPVFYADEIAKWLHEKDPDVTKMVKEAFGESIFEHGKLVRQKLAQIVFEDSEQLQRLNAIIHPAVNQAFKAWVAQQKAPIVIKEAAILIESGANKSCDEIILVLAPEKIKFDRLLQRDQCSMVDIQSRMKSQMSDDAKIPYAHYIIDNSEKKALVPQVLALVNQWKEC